MNCWGWEARLQEHVSVAKEAGYTGAHKARWGEGREGSSG